jgi:HPt (histidine-containing phosphotransfer) domain-containing protein
VAGAREFFLEAGMNDFISKPLDPKALNRKLMKWLPAGTFTLEKRDGEKRNGSGPSRDAGNVPFRAAFPAARSADSAGEAFTESVIDRKAGLGNAAGDAGLYTHLLELFRADHGGDAEKMKRAITEGDGEEARRIAHTMKSIAALIGAEKLRQSAAALEKLCAAGSPAALAGSLELRAFEDSFRAVMAELEKGAGPG